MENIAGDNDSASRRESSIESKLSLVEASLTSDSEPGELSLCSAGRSCYILFYTFLGDINIKTDVYMYG